MRLHIYKNFPIQDYTNEVYYTSQSERDKAFYNATTFAIDNISDINFNKKVITLDIPYSDLVRYNYGCISTEIGDTSKMPDLVNNIFIFIDNIEWSQNLRTATIHFSIDYFQTYIYQIDFQNCFIEREHVKDDTFGKHILDEGLPFDEYIIQDYEELNGRNNGMYFCIATSDVSNVLSQSANGYVALPSVSKPSKYEQSILIVYDDDLNNITSLISLLTARGKSDGISGFYSVPKSAISDKISSKCYTTDTADCLHYITICDDDITTFYAYMQRPIKIQNYTPNNSKCFTYPYCFVNISNNNGNSIKAQFEKVSGTNKELIEFEYYFPIIEGSTSFGYLKNYENIIKNFDYTIQGNTNIELPFVTNTFSAYMSANQNSISNQYKTIERNENMSIVKNAVSTTSSLIGSVMTGNVGGFIQGTVNSGMNLAETKLNSYNQRANIDNALKDVANRPNVAHGSFIGNGNILANKLGFTMQLITVTEENIKMIDNYFDLFGYKVNRIGTPNLNSRPYFNYVKTNGCNLVAPIPCEAINVIKNVFDNGITLWHKLEYMYKYNQYKDINK